MAINHSSSKCPKYVRRTNIRPVKNGLKARDFARDYTDCFYCRQVSVFTTSDLFEIAWMLQK